MSEFSWLLEDRSDDELKNLLRRYLRSKQEHEQEIDRIKPVLGAIDRELEMRDLAGGFEELKAFRLKLKNPTKTKIPAPKEPR